MPSPLSTELTPRRCPGEGQSRGREARVVTVKVMGWPTMAVVVAALVMEGTWFTTSMKLWLIVPATLVAVMVSG